MPFLTAVIITKNEERNIGRCLRSLKGLADDVVVVDSGSADRTAEICREHGVRFFPHPWEGYAEQKNYADSLVHEGWILSLDADEELSADLRSSLSSLKSKLDNPSIVYSFSRLNNYCGTWIRHGDWYPDIHVRLWYKGRASWQGVVHEQLCYASPMRCVRLQGDLLHYSYESTAHHAERIVKYALLAADKSSRQGKRSPMSAVIFKPMWTFIRGWLFKGGFLDGRQGWVVARMTAFYTFVKYVRLRELNRNKQG